MRAASRSSGISLRRGKSMVRPHGGRRQSAIPRSLLAGPYERKPSLRAKIKSRTRHVRRINKARVYELASMGRCCAILAPPAFGLSSTVRLLDTKISNSVRIAARSSKNRKGHVRKSTGTIEPSTICRQAGRSERAPERVLGTKTVRSLPPAAIGRVSLVGSSLSPSPQRNSDFKEQHMTSANAQTGLSLSLAGPALLRALVYGRDGGAEQC
jgi:hypothetical protein